MKTSRNYIIAVALLAVLAVGFGVFGTAAPPLAEEGVPVQPQQESSSDSVGHFLNPPSYDSGWVDIRGKRGQYFNFTHNLNTTETFVDIVGKQSEEVIGGEHQINLGATKFAPMWNRTFRETYDEIAYSLIQTLDGGYALAGSTDSIGAGNHDFWLVKTDADGNMQWSRTYGGSQDDAAWCVVQAHDGGFAVAGETRSTGSAGGYDFWLVKVDAAGNLEWNKMYGGTQHERAYCVVNTVDGGYLLAGSRDVAGQLDFYWIKTDSSGNYEWQGWAGGSANEEAHSVVQTTDAGYALAGYTESDGDADFWLVKINDVGVKQWNKTYGGAYDDKAYSMVQTSDGGCAMAGTTNLHGPSYSDFLLVKTDSNGNMQWNKTYNGGAEDDIAYSLVQTNDGGYLLAGSNTPTHVRTDWWLAKTDATGNMLWNMTGGETDMDETRSVVETADGGYALAGYTESLVPDTRYDFLLIKVGAEYGLTWTGSTSKTITIYRGRTDAHWNYMRVRIWLIKEPSWIYGDINMDGIVDAKDLYILGQNYGKTFSMISLSGIAAIAGVYTYKKRKRDD